MNQHQRPWVYAVLAVGVGVLAVAVLVLLVQTWALTDKVRATQVENTHARKVSDQTLAVIEDCTKPSGGCYKDGQRRTASAVGDINRVVILAAACSSGLPDGLSINERQSRIQQCVIDRLAVGGKQ